MYKILIEIIKFILTFFVTYIVFFFLVIKKILNARSVTNKKIPVDILYILKRYNIDIKKIDYNSLLKTVYLVNSIAISLIITVFGNVNNYVISLLLGGLIFIVLMIFVYHIIGKYYNGRG